VNTHHTIAIGPESRKPRRNAAPMIRYTDGWPGILRQSRKWKRRLTRIRRDKRKCRSNRHLLQSKSVATQACHPRSSLLICVHLRFHFLSPDPTRNRRACTIVILAAKRSRTGVEVFKRMINRRSHGVPPFCHRRSTAALVWLRPPAALCPTGLAERLTPGRTEGPPEEKPCAGYDGRSDRRIE
jgi:hypothetical protein